MTQRTKKTSQNKSRNKEGLKPKEEKIDRAFEYQDFIKWIALPKSLREPRTQETLAKKYKLAPETLSRWKNREGFWDAVREKIKEWARDKTPNVIQAVYQKITKGGNAQEAKLWFQFIENWAEKTESEVGPPQSLVDLLKRAYENKGSDEKNNVGQ